ncbi:MAG: tRNA-(ms[2]io[6]A)-hydroxylase [Archangiaceae bacterium]|nr:tRNA-(ms[2]io[6]A)-hydroxylase [Archangiaceae bacterium]
MILKAPTDPRWLPLALERFDEVLVDHAHCEKKAAANALSLLQVYPDVPGLPAQMARLAREESSHLAKVLALMEARGLSLGRDPGDPYAKGLQELMRHGSRERRLDRLLIAGIIESRSHERLQLLADGLGDASLKRLYAELAKSEDGHQKLFVRLARGVEPEREVDARLDELLEAEARLLTSLPLRAAIH